MTRWQTQKFSPEQDCCPSTHYLRQRRHADLVMLLECQTIAYQSSFSMASKVNISTGPKRSATTRYWSVTEVPRNWHFVLGISGTNPIRSADPQFAIQVKREELLKPNKNASYANSEPLVWQQRCERMSACHAAKHSVLALA